jgi:hypothetical protein
MARTSNVLRSIEDLPDWTLTCIYKKRTNSVSAQYLGGGPTRQLTIPRVVILDG